MKLSNETKTILSNFAKVHQSLHVKKGEPLMSISEARTLCVKYPSIPEFADGPDEFGIYDLNQFLTIMSLVEDGDIAFTSKGIKIADRVRNMSYQFASLEVIKSRPPKDVDLENPTIALHFSANLIKEIIKASKTLGASFFSLVQEEGANAKIVVSAGDEDSDTTGNVFEIALDEKFDHIFDLKFRLAQSCYCILPGGYEVEILRDKIAKWSHDDTEATYMVALEKESSFE